MAFIDLGANAYLMKDVSAISGKPDPSEISIGTATEDIIKAVPQGETVSKLSGGENPVRWNRVLHVLDV